MLPKTVTDGGRSCLSCKQVDVSVIFAVVVTPNDSLNSLHGPRFSPLLLV